MNNVERFDFLGDVFKKLNTWNMFTIGLWFS